MENNMNFAVPSARTMEQQFEPFKHNVSKPAVIYGMLDQFAQVNHPRRPVKLSIDDKKIAIGFSGELGEEDLNGHEQRPTLCEREARLNQEIETLDKLMQSIQDFDHGTTQVKAPAHDALQIMSHCLKEVEIGKLVTEIRKMIQESLNQGKAGWNHHSHHQ